MVLSLWSSWSFACGRVCDVTCLCWKMFPVQLYITSQYSYNKICISSAFEGLCCLNVFKWPFIYNLCTLLLSGVYWLPFYWMFVPSLQRCMEESRVGPSVRGLLRCNDLQPCIQQKLCKVTDLGTRASWPTQHGVWPLCGNTLLFLFTYQLHRPVEEFCSGNSVVIHTCVTWKFWKWAATPWGSRIAYLPRQVYDLDHIHGFVFKNN